LDSFNSLLGLARSLVIYRRPGRRRGLRRLYGPFVGRGDLVFDIGAHVGDRTAAFASLGARGVALEPQPRIAGWLRRLVGGTPGVTVVEAAVGREPGSARLAVSARTPTVSTLSDSWKRRMGEGNPGFRDVRWETAVDVRVTTLDALIGEHGVPRFCKIDVEGFEAEILEGLSHPVPALSFEFVRGGLDVARRCVARLRSLGDYEYNVVEGEERAFRLAGWRSADQIDTWLAAGADDLASGDLYARTTVREER